MDRRELIGCLMLLLLFGSSKGGDAASFSYPVKPATPPTGPPRIPMQYVPPELRPGVQSVLDRPSLTAHGPSEQFNCVPAMYCHLLAHPEQAVKLWRLIGARVADIEELGKGAYRYTDGQGSDVRWHALPCGRGLHVWYAEGKAKATRLLPAASFKAVLVMQYQSGRDADGVIAVKHQVHFVLRAESRAVALATKILGSSAPRLLEQYLGGLQTFYGGLSWYLSSDDARARGMFKQIEAPYPFGPQR